ncbi:LysR family transcriptional regulator [Pelagimonas varians]|uniref:HTH-type transcriptional regulator CynR n=1 Tax=Pelagimonas varians TaxID=696760 RepID=A0A238KBD6_9RHOB|nr:LysR family transcriptional regulator [Pelagimonas varians]PYG31026.1 DNA-binding transcriptional LysR family regulator [Pelagimonas varians]SMX39462.1 HTH-type transcriptional regulator CynR [Pelagimonas varians]
MRHIKIQQMRYFVAVYEERSITAAAHRVNATQSGVSMQIRDFEDGIGHKLFERTSTGVTPTKVGDQIYIRCNRVLLEVDQLAADVEAHTDQLYGTVRAGIMPTFAKSILAPTLIEFAGEHPFVDVRIIEGYSETLTAKVAQGDLDFAVVPGGELPIGVRSTHVDTDLEILVQNRKDTKGDPDPIHLTTSPPLNLVLPGPGNARRPRIDRYLSNMCQSKHSILELDSMMATFDLLYWGGYASVLPGCLCLPSIEDPRLKLSPLLDPVLQVDYLLIEPTAKARSKAVSAFADSLCAQINKWCQFGRDTYSRD